MFKYFFPSPFKRNERINLEDENLKFNISNLNFLDSGKSALRLALRSLNLEYNSKIGISSFCCDAVEEAVKNENLIPCFFDLKDNNSYWGNYSEEKIIKEKIHVIILIHLYGFKHPDTDKILEYCKENKVVVIHDIAQSFGIDVSNFGDNLIIYSFGPGKSTAAALGGEIVFPLVYKNQSSIIMQQVLGSSNKQRIDSILFYYSRIYNYKFNLFLYILKLLNKIVLHITIIKQSNAIRRMTNFQKRKAIKAKFLTLTKSDERRTRYQYLTNVLSNHSKIKLTYDDNNGLNFKLVLYIPSEVDKFVTNLTNQNVPFYRLGPDINLSERNKEKLVNFYETYYNFIEISTERSIDMAEIKRVGEVLKEYK